ncbi:hypothetical protein A0256_16975 [Mucilaginibacter sp. PAMC 26640]|nr:hypothetical protein A0256_16975 [Mucilaginibacter sp. PAMC 26640]
MAKNLWYKITKSHIIRFLLSASAGFLVDMLLFYMLFNVVFKRPSYLIFTFPVSNSSLALAISYSLGVVVNFTMTKLLVFKASETSPAQQFIRFSAVAFVGFFANLGVLTILIKNLHVYAPYARVGAALSLFVASYFVHKFFSFSLSLRQHHQHEVQPNH